MELKVERYGFAFMDFSALYKRSGKPFIQALSLIDIALYGILPSECYCEFSGHFWPLNDCNNVLDGDIESVIKEANEFAEGEYEESDLREMIERMRELDARGKEYLEHWCNGDSVFNVIQEVEAACKGSDCEIAQWCFTVAKSVREAFKSSCNWKAWYNNRPEAAHEGYEPLVALYDDWGSESNAYQMAFECGETHIIYAANTVDDLLAMKRVCELRTLGAQLLDKAIDLHDTLSN